MRKIILLTCFLSSCTFFQTRNLTPAYNNGVATRVEIEVQKDKSILLTYTFSQPVIGFKFLRDYSQYRAEYWKALDADIEVAANKQGLEIIRSRTGKLFSKVSFQVLPLKQLLETDYSPLIPFSNGEALLYPQQFTVITLSNLEGFKDWKPLEDFKLPSSQSVIISSPQFKQGIFDGEQHFLPYDVTHLLEKNEDGPYVYIGNQTLSSQDKFITIVDPNVPRWVISDVLREFPRAMKFLEQKFSVAPPKVPNLFVTQLDFEPNRKTRIRGDASKASKTRPIAMMLRGDGWSKASPERKEDLSRITVHEPIHIWNSPNVTDFAPIAWMYEGGAEALRVRTEFELKIRSSKEYKENHDIYAQRCVEKYISPLTLDAMKVIPTYNLVYACGFMIGLVTEQILKDKDYFKFWSELLRRARLKEMRYGKEDYFGLLNESSDRKDVILKIRHFIESPRPDRRRELIELLQMVDVKVIDEAALKFDIPLPK